MNEVLIDDRGTVRWIVLNRPEAMNAITGTMPMAKIVATEPLLDPRNLSTIALCHIETIPFLFKPELLPAKRMPTLSDGFKRQGQIALSVWCGWTGFDFKPRWQGSPST